MYAPDSVLQLAEEAAIPESAKWYCPVPTCSQLVLSKDQASVISEGECSACHVALCLTCRSLGHKGMTCAEAQVSINQVCSMLHVHGVNSAAGHDDDELKGCSLHVIGRL